MFLKQLLQGHEMRPTSFYFRGKLTGTASLRFFSVKSFYTCLDAIYDSVLRFTYSVQFQRMIFEAQNVLAFPRQLFTNTDYSSIETDVFDKFWKPTLQTSLEWFIEGQFNALTVRLMQ